MSLEENKALVRRVFEEAYNAKQLAVIQEVFASDCVVYSTDGSSKAGREAVEAHFTYDHTGWPDAHLAIEDQIAEGDQVATRWSWRGTHTGATSALGPPTGKAAPCVGVVIARIVNGQIVEFRWLFDWVGYLEKIGLAVRTAPNP